MSDRLTEIRARLDAATPGPWLDADHYVWGGEPRFMVVEHAPCRTDARFIAHAPADIAWLLRRLDFEERLVADLEAELDRVRERHAAEVERLRGNEPVAQGVTKLECSDG